MNLKLIVILLFVCGFVTACGNDSTDTHTNANDQIDTEGANQAAIEKSLAKAKLWRGSASGYTHVSQPDNDRIELFIRFGKLLGAASAYNHRAGELRSLRALDAETMSAGRAYLATLFNPQLLALYKEVDPMVQENAKQTNTPLDIQSVLTTLSDPQQIIDISNGDRAKRDQQYAANQRLNLLPSRVRNAVISFFPSRHEFLLASSALIREAGDKTAMAVSADGVILDTNILGEAFALIDRSTKLDPRNITYCDAQRLPMSAHKDSIDELLNKMVPNKLGQKLSVTATDVYELANQAQLAGKRFPIKDTHECN